MPENPTIETIESPYDREDAVLDEPLHSEETYEHYVAENQHEQRRKLSSLLNALLAVLGMIIAGYFLVLAVLFLLGWTAAPLPFASATEDVVVEETATFEVANFTDEQLAAQMCMVIVDSQQSAGFSSLTKEGVGAIVLAGNTPSASFAKDVASAQSDAAQSVQAFIVSDEHPDQVGRLEELCGTVPNAKTLSKTKASEVETTIEAYGNNLQEQGVNFVLGPVADINQDGAALAKSNRCFEGGTDKVAECCQAWCNGMGNAGVATAIKHWPGLGSFADVNEVVTAYKPWSNIESSEVTIFSRSSDAADAIVVSHVIVPDFTENKTPTSLSRAALSYLRDDVGDDALIITDNIDMLVSAGLVPSEAAAVIESLNAGADMVIFKPNGKQDVVSELASAISSGTMDRTDAQAKVERIIRLKSNMDLSPKLGSKISETK
ncbi:MAG: hypothetical protein FWD41_02430 [Actinomycetia bacterium]|nr:hypothetical protein [Actinomycetes bacterium]